MKRFCQTQAPLLEALGTLAKRDRAAFHTPGHKQGRSIPPRLAQLLGAEAFRADLPELPELDNLFAPEGVIQHAQWLAAEAFGAEQTWFLVNGSTSGIEAAVLATCGPGDKLILPRNAHQSAIAALILSGAMPIWVEPAYDAHWQLAHCPTPDTLADTLAAHPDAKAVLIISPTYYGVCGDIAAIAHLTHARNLPLLIDEAHGAHFAFHPNLPTPALIAGADLVVQSIHKTLSAFTQSAMLHVQGERIDRDRLRKALQLVQSSSPNYLLLASLDAARQQMATQGEFLMAQTLQLAEQARQQLSQIPGLAVLSTEHANQTRGFSSLDLTRLTVDVTGLGLTGFAADDILHPELGVTAELPTLNHLTFIISLGNTPADIERLVEAFQQLATRQTKNPVANQPVANQDAETPPNPSFVIPPRSACSPREAFFAPTQTLPIEAAIHRISAELVCPYPPGIPILFPGEAVTLEAVHYLQQVVISGGILTGCADPTLTTSKSLMGKAGGKRREAEA
ncbi:MAG: aminotransferase class I/II-fold pyridoxal phosphate-dependent enzyme [Cyanobacteria bacterium RM1_2_2]|nr:aminotransferase class I/II-fold pyridoxal phosphate-dependent enzyme [Cyanobacteria bacterium RM1_2_2]